MKAKNILFGVLFLFFWSSTNHLWAAEGGLRIVYPLDRSVVNLDRIRVVGLVSDPGVKSVTCQVKGGEVLGNPVIPVLKEAFNASVRLKRGLNEVAVADQGGRLFAKISIFLLQEGAKPPDEFRPFFIHSPLAREEQCQDCHNLTGKAISYKRMIPSATCTSAQCHGEMGKAKFVHGPVGGGTCIACHNPHGTANDHIVTRPGGEGCYICHDSKRQEFKGKVIHAPVAGGDCGDCHDPHQSPLKFQLKGSSREELCFTCHDSTLIKQANLHTPLKGGDCIACHNAHSSPNAKLLTAPAERFCLSCHEDVQKGLKKRYVHKPVRENCQKCHDPHSSPHKAQLLKVQAELCMDCHQSLHPKIAQAVATAKFPHQPVKKGDCVACHEAHFTDFEKLLKAPLQDICFTCHQNLSEKVKSDRFHHGPVAQNDCAACHDTHGSLSPKILRSYFPEEFYIPYKTENYAICFDCHSKDIALSAVTLELTDFRNGDRNLHFVHVNKQKGRSCKACHEVHSGNQPKHIREQVPFGTMWSYPIRYTKTETGGTCVVGCHKPLGYDRTKPVKY